MPAPDPSPLWIAGGRVIDPASGRDEIADLFSLDGRLVASLPETERPRARRIDAAGLVVCPGLVDIHVHFREPGQTHKETIQSGSRAAAAGGFTTVVCMPNTAPPADNAGIIQYIKDVIDREAVVHVYPSGCITVGMKGEKLAPSGSLKRAGVVAITDDGACVQQNELMRRAVEYAAMFGLPVMDHCQDESLTHGSVMHEGLVSLRLGLKGWPSAAEDIVVSRNVILSTHTGAHIHLQHISSATAVDIIRRAKQRGVRITAEASPHHLALTDDALLDYDTNFKMNPPLRSEADRQALVEGILDGTLDCIATDHAPHTDYEKDVEFDYAPFGIVGLETALPVVLDVFHHSGKLNLPATLDLLTRKPADILGLPAGRLAEGAPADITLFDPEETWTPTPTGLHSKSANSPWLGATLRGRVRKTFVAGRLVHSPDDPTPAG
ncbi:MAG: dihydroorotase [Puniceicoccaceae bacterium]|nr:MAG: dihydroorotase [Puniceicoccaceae bacterium]